MPRPIIRRRITGIPSITAFIPAEESEVGGGPENVLKLEELEAIRLKDLEGLDQAECASHMAVSRPTFQRILLSAREKVADSLLHGKAIRIEGGVYVQIDEGRGYCRRCGRSWALKGSVGARHVLEAESPDAGAGTLPDHANPPPLCPECAGEEGRPARGHCRRGRGMHQHERD